MVIKYKTWKSFKYLRKYNQLKIKKLAGSLLKPQNFLH